MFDTFAEGLRAASSHSPWAVPLVFAAGAVSSAGPCIAPRSIAVATLASGSGRRALSFASAFTGGLACVYALFGTAVALINRAVAFSSVTYAAVAVALAAGAVVTLWRGHHECSNARSRSIGGASAAFLLGASFALVLSPCCAPLALGIAAYASASGDPIYGAELLACFGLGHALPIFGAAIGANKVMRLVGRISMQAAAEVVSATLMLALSAYYGILA